MEQEIVGSYIHDQTMKLNVIMINDYSIHVNHIHMCYFTLSGYIPIISYSDLFDVTLLYYSSSNMI